MKRAHSKIIQCSKKSTEAKPKCSVLNATASKPPGDHSDMDDFAPENMQVCTPKKGKWSVKSWKHTIQKKFTISYQLCPKR